MSSGPTLTGSGCIKATSKKYVNLKIGPHLWCTYPHECKRKHLIFHQDDICDHCEWKRKLNIPQWIDDELKEMKNESS